VGLVVAFVLGTIGAIVVFLALLGLLLFRGIRLGGSVDSAPSTFDERQVRRSLDQVYQSTHGRLPPEAQSRVAHIRQEILDLLPHVRELPAGSQDRYVLQRTALDYLPTTIQAYLALPPSYVVAGKTSLAALDEQLAILDGQMVEISAAIRQRDSDRLLANGLFLEEKFGRPAELSAPAAGENLESQAPQNHHLNEA
jgi:hypothetical protein